MIDINQGEGVSTSSTYLKEEAYKALNTHEKFNSFDTAVGIFSGALAYEDVLVISEKFNIKKSDLLGAFKVLAGLSNNAQWEFRAFFDVNGDTLHNMYQRGLDARHKSSRRKETTEDERANRTIAKIYDETEDKEKEKATLKALLSAQRGEYLSKLIAEIPGELSREQINLLDSICFHVAAMSCMIENLRYLYTIQGEAVPTDLTKWIENFEEWNKVETK